MPWPVWPKGNEKALAGYASADTAHLVRLASPTADTAARGNLRAVTQELYEAFFQMDIRWSREMYHAAEAVQVIRPPRAILRGAGDGTCLDLVLVMAGAALGKELLPVVVVMDGHAMLAVSNRVGRRQADSYARRAGEEPLFTDGLAQGEAAAAALRRMVDAGEYTLIECTGFARVVEALDSTTPEGRGRDAGVMSFARAVEAGREQLDFAGRELIFAIDVAYLQDIVTVERYDPVDDGLGRINADLRQRHRRLMEDYSLVGGRDAELDQLDGFVTNQPSGYCLLVGAPGSGKTAVLAEWIRRRAVEPSTPTVYHFLSRQYGTADRQFDFFQSLLQQASWAWRGESLPEGTISVMESSWLALLDPARPPSHPVVVVIDGADEADGWALNKSMFPRRLPDGVHIVISARTMAGTDWRQELGVPGAKLVTLKPLDDDSVRAILEQVDAPAWLREPAAFDLLSSKAEGDPFYLRLICDQAGSGEITTVADLERTPDGLEAFIETWWQDVRQTAGEPGVQCLLSYLTVALAPMTRGELVDIDPDDALTGFTFDSTLEKIERYVAGDPSDLGISFAHWRLRDFVARKVLSPAEIRKATGTVVAWCDQWREHHARYALAKGLAHRLALADALSGEQRSAAHRVLVDLVGDVNYQMQRAEKIGDAAGLVADMNHLCRRLSAEAAPDVASLVTIALVYVDARTRLLHPGVVFDLARRGQWDEATARLDLLPASAFWRSAARLCIAWQAARSPDTPTARRLLDEEVIGFSQLRPLARRVGQATAGEETGSRSAPSRDLALLAEAAAILGRLASRDNVEGSAPPATPPSRTEPAWDEYGRPKGGQAPEYGIDHDSRMMVEVARDHPDEGDRLLTEYIDQLGANPYSDYRNRALGFLLHEVSLLPDPDQARRTTVHIVEAALQPSPVRFSEYLWLILRQRELDADPTTDELASAALLDRARNLKQRAEAAIEVDYANHGDRRNDLWSFLRRELAVTAEAVAPIEPPVAEQLLDLAVRFESGFAGFRAPAYLALAAANVVVRPDAPQARLACLDAARRAAHNIQDPSFCARSTAMVNRMERWMVVAPSATAGLSADIDAFLGSPARTIDYGSLHRVGERFGERSRLDHVPIDHVSNARTLEVLALDVFQIPVSLMERANAGIDRAALLHTDQEIVVPDASFVPHVAMWFSARLIASDLPAAEKTRLLARLVPIALADPTALDTVLGRMVAVAPDVNLDAVRGIVHLAHTFEPQGFAEYGHGWES